MNKETRKFIWGFFWMIIGGFVAVAHYEPALANDSFFTFDMLILVAGLFTTVSGYLRIDSVT